MLKNLRINIESVSEIDNAEARRMQIAEKYGLVLKKIVSLGYKFQVEFVEIMNLP